MRVPQWWLKCNHSHFYSSTGDEDIENKTNLVAESDEGKYGANLKNPSRNSNFYVGIIQVLEEAIRNKRKANSFSKNDNKIDEISGERYLETIQHEHTNNIDSNINLQHSNNEEEKCEAEHKNCFLNIDKCNDDLNDSKYNHLNSDISFLSSSSPTTSAATKEKDETLDILNTFDTGTSTFEKDLCNLNETEQKEIESDITQVDKCPIRLFLIILILIIEFIVSNIF